MNTTFNKIGQLITSLGAVICVLLLVIFAMIFFLENPKRKGVVLDV